MTEWQYTVFKTFLKRILWELEIMNGKEPSLTIPIFDGDKERTAEIMKETLRKQEAKTQAAKEFKEQHKSESIGLPL